MNKNDGSGSEWRLAARHTIQCGPVNHLEPGYLIQLFNLFVYRQRSGIDPSQRLSGGLSGNQVNLSASAGRENTTSAAPLPVVTNHVALDGSGNINGQMINSAPMIAGILAATTPTPVVDATGMKTMQPREIKVCDDDGNPYWIIVLASSGHTKP